MLRRVDLNYANRAAREWADENADLLCDKDERAHFSYYFQNECDEANTLDVNIRAAFNFWAEAILPSLRGENR